MANDYPTLPNLPTSIFDEITPEQQRENRLVWARWILANKRKLAMETWHHYGYRFSTSYCMKPDDAAYWAHRCGTVHCCAGHATAMGGVLGFEMEAEDGPREAAFKLLGIEPGTRFRPHLYTTSNELALAWLQRVVDTDGEFCDPLDLCAHFSVQDD